MRKKKKQKRKSIEDRIRSKYLDIELDTLEEEELKIALKKIKISLIIREAVGILLLIGSIIALGVVCGYC